MTGMQPEDHTPKLGAATLMWTAGLSLAVFAGLLFYVPPLTAALSAYLFWSMALITVADLRYFIVPDVISLPAIPVGLAASAILHPEGDWLTGLTSGLIGAAAGAGALYLLRAAYFVLRGVEGLGLGDVKLAAVAGAWLGPEALAPACLVATLSALVAVLVHAAVSGRSKIAARRYVPFGSFIAPTIVVFWLERTLSAAPIW